MPASRVGKNNALNYNFGATAYPDTLPATMWFGLAITSAVTETTTGATVTEPAGNGYARVDYTNNKTTWSVSTLGTLANAIDIIFPECTPVSWGTALSIFIADAETNGNIWWYYTLSPTFPVIAGTITTFEAGSIVASM